MRGPAARFIGAHKSTSILNSYEHFQTILMLLNLTNNPLKRYFIVTFCNLPDFFQFTKLFIPQKNKIRISNVLSMLVVNAVVVSRCQIFFRVHNPYYPCHILYSYTCNPHISYCNLYFLATHLLINQNRNVYITGFLLKICQ